MKEFKTNIEYIYIDEDWSAVFKFINEENGKFEINVLGAIKLSYWTGDTIYRNSEVHFNSIEIDKTKALYKKYKLLNTLYLIESAINMQKK